MDVTPICHLLVTLTLDTVDAGTEIKNPNYCLMFAKVWQCVERNEKAVEVNWGTANIMLSMEPRINENAIIPASK